ncbi:MAG: hypothetical protein H6811_09330 [Phycisphaeraceae bacterium]|nr:hypothetical protein [Phycisphaeraceae bacterium]
MALIRQADASTIARDAIALDLGDLARQGDAVIRAAREEADRILKEAGRERDRRIADAAKIGDARGYQEGLVRGESEGRDKGESAAREAHAEALSRLEASWSSALERFEGIREAILIDARRNVVGLALAIASRVVKRVIRAEPTLIAEQIDAALELVTRPSRLVIRVHSDDVGLARACLPRCLERASGSHHAEIVGDGSMDRGSVVVRTESGGEIDLSLETQLDRIAKAIVPGLALSSQEAA